MQKIRHIPLFLGGLLLSIIILLGAAEQALACNVCALAYADYFLPPVLLWQLFPVIWFIVICIVAGKQYRHEIGLQKTWLAILIGIVTIIAGNLIGVGPLFSLLLLIPPLILAVQATRKTKRSSWGADQSEKYVMASVVGVLFFISLLSTSFYLRAVRTPGAYVVQWEGNGPGRAVLAALENDPAVDLNDVRLVVKEARSLDISRLVDQLGTRGHRTIDVPILLTALEKAGASSASRRTVTRIEAALQKLTGIVLPPRTSVAAWQQAIQQQARATPPDPQNRVE